MSRFNPIPKQVVTQQPASTTTYKRDPSTLILDGSITANWAKWYGNAVVADAVNLKNATKGIKITDNGVGTAMRNNTIRPFTLKGRKNVTAFVYIENAKSIVELSFYFATATNYSSYVSYKKVNNTLTDGWNEVMLDLTKPTEGDPATVLANKIVSFQVRLQTNTGETSNVTFDSMYLNKVYKPSVIFTFDDGWSSQYTNAFPMLMERGFKGNVGVVPSLVGTANYATLAQLQEMQRYGWDIFNHTYNHKDLTSITTAEARQEVALCKNWMNQNGFTKASDVLAYPFGAHNVALVNALKNDVRYARSLVEGLEANYPIEPLRGRTRNLINLPASSIIAYIDDAIRTGGTLVICGHRIEDTVDSTVKYSKADFATILDYLYDNRDKVEVKTLTEWISENK